MLGCDASCDKLLNWKWVDAEEKPGQGQDVYKMVASPSAGAQTVASLSSKQETHQVEIGNHEGCSFLSIEQESTDHHDFPSNKPVPKKKIPHIIRGWDSCINCLVSPLV